MISAKYPSTPPDYSLPEIIAVASPAAGINWTQTVPANTIWLLLSVNFRLTTDATAVTRGLKIQINDGATLTSIGLAGQSQTASLIRDYIFLHANHGNLTVTQIPGNLTQPIFIQPGWTLTSSVENIQATDSLTVITLYVHRWLINI